MSRRKARRRSYGRRQHEVRQRRPLFEPISTADQDGYDEGGYDAFDYADAARSADGSAMRTYAIEPGASA